MTCDSRHQTRMAQRRSYARLLGVVLVGLVGLGVLGCARTVQGPKSKVQGPELPMPQQFSAASRTERAEAAAVIAPSVAVRSVTWRWTFPPGHRLAWWDTSTDLKHWDFGGWTTNNYVTFELTNKAQFFVFYSLPWSNSFRIGNGKPQPPDFWQP